MDFHADTEREVATLFSHQFKHRCAILCFGAPPTTDLVGEISARFSSPLRAQPDKVNPGYYRLRLLGPGLRVEWLLGARR
jgi:hypothetical protein